MILYIFIAIIILVIALGFILFTMLLQVQTIMTKNSKIFSHRLDDLEGVVTSGVVIDYSTCFYCKHKYVNTMNATWCKRYNFLVWPIPLGDNDRDKNYKPEECRI